MKWVTWENVGVDRMASAWLIIRFIDPHAHFAFIPEQSVPTTVEDAELFDVPGVRLTHRRGHCTFHTIIREYGIQDPILESMAYIIDEADTVQIAPLEPAAVGLDWVCRGLRQTCRDDSEALEKSYPIFEGLYAFIGENGMGHAPQD